MTRSNPLQAAFNAGELGPRLAARVDFAKYRNAGARVENLTPLPQGGLTRRPGTRFVAAAADHGKRPRLIPFEFSTEQAYVLEAGEGAFRFFRNKARIIVQPTDATVTNGTFDTDIAGWDDISTGSANITSGKQDPTEFNTLQFATTQGLLWGQTNSPARACIGIQFVAPANAQVLTATIQNGVHPSGSTSFTAIAGIYQDSANTVGSQVGADSAAFTAGAVTFSFPSPPVITGGQTYWLVMRSTSAGRINTLGCANRPNVAGGFGTTPGAISAGSGGFPSNTDMRIRIRMLTVTADGTLNLNGNGADLAAAEQGVATTMAGQEHVIAFDVLGTDDDKAAIRVGSSTGGDQVLEEVELGVGRHTVAFTPDASPFYVQFLNRANKTVYIDNVTFLASGAAAAVPLTLEAPYQEDDLQHLKWAQSADVMYFAHARHAPRKLERRGHATWSLVRVPFQDGPYLDENIVPAMTLQPSATTGTSITITADGHSPFQPGDVGRPVRLRPSGEPGWAVITEVISPEQVRAAVKRAARWRCRTTTDSISPSPPTRSMPSAGCRPAGSSFWGLRAASGRPPRTGRW